MPCPAYNTDLNERRSQALVEAGDASLGIQGAQGLQGACAISVLREGEDYMRESGGRLHA